MSKVNLFYLSPIPSAILVVSAHWEEGVPTLTSGANPPLIYDYYGFPEESYASVVLTTACSCP